MALPATDNFDRANESPIAGNWTNYGGANRIVSNVAVGPTSPTDTFSKWNADTFNNDQYSKYTIFSTAGSMDGGPAVRIGASGLNGYFYATFYNSASYAKFVANSYTGLGSISTTNTTNDIVELRVTGTTIAGFKNGVAVSPASVTDSSLTSGGAGFFIYDSGVQVNNWEGGNIGGAASDLSGGAQGLVDATGAISSTTTTAGAAQVSVDATGAITSLIPISGASSAIVIATGVINQSVGLAGSSASASIASGLITMNIMLLGNGFIQTAASGLLNQTMPLDGASQGAADGVADLTQVSNSSLIGSASITSAGVGQINLTTTLSGAAISRLLASANIDTGSGLSGNAQMATDGIGALSSAMPVAGLANAIVDGNAVLSSTIALSGAASSTLTGSSNLDPGSGLTGDAHAVIDGTGSLVSAIPISGNAQAIVTGSTGLFSAIPLSGSAVTINNATGDITVGIGGLTGAAIIDALAGGNITMTVSVAANALARAIAIAGLTVVAPYNLPIGLYSIKSLTTRYSLQRA